MNEFGVVSNLPHAIGVIKVKVSGVNDGPISLPSDDRSAPTFKLVERINQNSFSNCNLWIVENLYHALDFSVLLGLAKPPEPGNAVEQGMHSLGHLLHVELESRDDAFSEMSDWLLEPFFGRWSRSIVNVGKSGTAPKAIGSSGGCGVEMRS